MQIWSEINPTAYKKKNDICLVHLTFGAFFLISLNLLGKAQISKTVRALLMLIILTIAGLMGI